MRINLQELIGKQYGKLTILKAQYKKQNNKSRLYCKCLC